MAFSMLNATAAVPVAARRVRGASPAALAAGKPSLRVQLRAAAPLQRAAAPRAVVLRAATGVCAVANFDGAALLKEKKAAKPMSIVFVSAEVAPWSKTGGLGDVVRNLGVQPLQCLLKSEHCRRRGVISCVALTNALCNAPQVGSLPVELAKRGHKVMTISPRCVSGPTLLALPQNSALERSSFNSRPFSHLPTWRAQLRSVRRRVGHRRDRERDGRGACLLRCSAARVA